MNYGIEIFPNGTVSIKDFQINEAMHSKLGPWDEAQLLYVEGSGIPQSLQVSNSNPLVIYDIGLGIASNSLATLECFLKGPTFRNISIFSFENELNGLRFALNQCSYFPFLVKYKKYLESLLFKNYIKIEKNNFYFEWNLLEGDFRSSFFNLPEADYIYYDLFSPLKCPELWSQVTFEKVFKKCHLNSLLVTYSSSTNVRKSLFKAGFFIGEGATTSQKRNTTHASKNLACLKNPLKKIWMQN